jgi:transketolase
VGSDSHIQKGSSTALPNQEVFAATLEKLAANDKQIVIVTSDSRGSGKLVSFANQFPKQVVEVGIAEQNLVGIAAGLASAGKKTFAVSPACFLTARSLEQIKNDVAYSDNPVKLIGISAGVSYGALGTTHHSLHDFAVLRAINNMIICAPADATETEAAVHAAASTNQPLYLRFGKKPMPFLPAEDNAPFAFGRSRTIKKGKDLVFIANGETVHLALLAAIKLHSESGIDAMVISMHSVKPIDERRLHEIGIMGVPVITVEEHMVNGGLGEAVASYFLQHGFFIPFRIVGIPDEYTVTGSQIEIFNHYGISEEGLMATGMEMISGQHKR